MSSVDQLDQVKSRDAERRSVRPRVLILASDVLFEHFISDAERQRLSEVSDWTQYNDREDSPRLRRELEQADVLITTWHSPFLRLDMFGSQPRVRLIAHCGGEVKSRVETKVLDHIAVTNAAEPMAAPVAEMAVALMLTLVRRLPEYAAEMRNGKIRTNEYVSSGETIRGRTVGLVGFGRIGKAFAQLIRPFGVELLVNDPGCSEEVIAEFGGKSAGLDDILRLSSVVVLAAGLTRESRGLLDQQRLSLMKNGAYLINVARGGLLDPDALMSELRSGRISAALDV